MILGDDHIAFPDGFLQRRAQHIEFARITSVSLRKVSGQEFLIIRTADTEATVARSLLTRGGAFERVVAVVCAHVSPAQS